MSGDHGRSPEIAGNRRRERVGWLTTYPANVMRFSENRPDSKAAIKIEKVALRFLDRQQPRVAMFIKWRMGRIWGIGPLWRWAVRRIDRWHEERYTSHRAHVAAHTRDQLRRINEESARMFGVRDRGE